MSQLLVSGGQSIGASASGDVEGREAWRAAVYGAAKSWTELSD